MANENRPYLLWLSTHPCAVPGCHDRSGPPHHPRHDVGLGRRAHDHRAVPICHQHHVELHAKNGAFLGWPNDRLRAWLDATGAALRQLFESDRKDAYIPY